MAYLTSLGWLMALPIALGIMVGNFVDGRFGTWPFWTLALLGAGIGVAALEVAIALRRALREGNDD